MRARWLVNLFVLAILVGVAVWGVLESIRMVGGTPDNEWWSGLWQNFSTEIIGAIITFILFELVVGAQRDREQKKEQQKRDLAPLMRRAHSRHNHIALAALEELRILGMLPDGALAYMEWRGSNWRDANLYDANLREADLTNADLYQADLVSADLTGAIVSDEQLASCDIMYQAIMPDGRRYDGRYRLQGDFALANRKKIDTDSPEAMADWYGVTLEQYLEGQKWADENLDALRGE
jgi:hypothetical protein